MMGAVSNLQKDETVRNQVNMEDHYTVSGGRPKRFNQHSFGYSEYYSYTATRQHASI
jgi:hypothetical protein